MTKEPSLDELKKETTFTLRSVKITLEGLLLEIKGGQRRHMDTSDFSIEEIRRLSVAVERLAGALERHK